MAWFGNMKKIIVYSTPTCPLCKMVKEFLKEKGAAYTEIDVANDENKAQEMIDKSGQMGVPVIVVAEENGKEEIIVGFDRVKLTAAIGAAK